jgi:hypothetical protein
LFHETFGQENSIYDMKWGADTLVTFSQFIFTLRFQAFRFLCTNLQSFEGSLIADGRDFRAGVAFGDGGQLVEVDPFQGLLGCVNLENLSPSQRKIKVTVCFGTNVLRYVHPTARSMDDSSQ